MKFVNILDGEIYTKQEIRVKENTSIPDHITDLSHMGYAYLHVVVPTYDTLTHKAEESGWELIDGSYFEKWAILEKTSEEIEVARQHGVPKYVAMWQARDVLIKYDLLDNVIDFINAIPDVTDRRRAQSKFEFSNTVQRNDPLVNYVISRAGYTQSQIDDWFIEAGKL
jgi:hypothetical protein